MIVTGLRSAQMFFFKLIKGGNNENENHLVRARLFFGGGR